MILQALGAYQILVCLLFVILLYNIPVDSTSKEFPILEISVVRIEDLNYAKMLD